MVTWKRIYFLKFQGLAVIIPHSFNLDQELPIHHMATGHWLLPFWSGMSLSLCLFLVSDIYAKMPMHHWRMWNRYHKWLRNARFVKNVFFFYSPLFLAMDVQAFERLLGPCMEIMKRNIATYEEQLVALFGTNMDIVEPTAWSKSIGARRPLVTKLHSSG